MSESLNKASSRDRRVGGFGHKINKISSRSKINKVKYRASSAS